MRIGIDGRPLQGQLTGVGRYVLELCRALDAALPEAEFFLYSQTPVAMPVDTARWRSRVEPWDWARRLKSALWLKLRAGMLARCDSLDVYWACATLLPRLPKGVQTLSTVYDLNYKVVPQTMSTATLWSHRLFFARDVHSADKVFAISRGTALRLERMHGRRADGVIFPAANSLFRPPTSTAIQEALRSYKVSKPYFLAVGTLEPRKNLELLIKVFIALRREGALTSYCLLLAGGVGWKDTRLRALLEDNPGAVRALGYVADQDLPALYAGSAAFVFPSLYEGYGMPALEARLCGAKVLAADIPEIREACGENGVFVKPDAAGLREGLIRVLAQSDAGAVSTAPSWAEGAAILAANLRDLARH